jgi:hypothetical protein
MAKGECLDAVRRNLEETKRMARARTLIVGMRWRAPNMGWSMRAPSVWHNRPSV